MNLTASSPTSQPLAWIDAATLKQWLHDGAEIALLDIREYGQYGAAHIFQSVSAPYSELECVLDTLVPRLTVRIVAYDDGDGVADAAARALVAMGYQAVHVLQGGAPAWRAAGHHLFAGVNVPGKTFGELTELEFDTPHLGPQELARRQASGENLIVLDGRPYTEYQKMSIPGGVCCPNGELALHVHQLVPDPATTIVVNCAGRTRSIIGAQTLINFGVPNPVFALENGTQGWYLDDLGLAHGATGRHAPAASVDPAAIQASRPRARALAERAGVRFIDADEAARWLADPARTTYLCDVRTPEEFNAGTVPGAQSTPGGQLIQATDHYVGVRGARLVLIDQELVRAPVVASWMAQMGWEAAVLGEGDRSALSKASVLSETHAGQTANALGAVPPAIAATGVAAAQGKGARLIDVRPSAAYCAGHIEGAVWSIRPRLDRDGIGRLGLSAATSIVLLASDAGVAALAARTLTEAGLRDIRVNLDSPQAWRDAGLHVAATPDLPPEAERIDFIFFAHDRHDGNKQAARQYLDWETDLIRQLDPQERAIFDFTPRQAE